LLIDRTGGETLSFSAPAAVAEAVRPKTTFAGYSLDHPALGHKGRVRPLAMSYTPRYRHAGTLSVSQAYLTMHDDARVIIYNAGTAFLAGAWLWLGVFLAIRPFF
jgi:hypothetical protein